MKIRKFLFVLVASMMSLTVQSQLLPTPLKIRILSSGIIEFSSSDGESIRKFMPEFTVLYRTDNPGLGFSRYYKLSYALPHWKSINNADSKNRDYYKSAEVITIKSRKLIKNEKSFRLVFDEHPLFSLTADIITTSDGFAEIEVQFAPKKEGYFSVGYTGALKVKPNQLDELWQPYIWQELRFPDQCYLTVDDASPLPSTTITYRGITSGVVVNPTVIPYKMPHFSRLKYGLMVRNQKGDAQPQVFSPVLGMPDSRMKPGDHYAFKFNIFSIQGKWIDAYKYLAYKLFGFGDYRRNATCSLNETIENMVQFAMNDHYSGWIEELKAFDYKTDVKNTVKLVSSLHPLSLAIITDNEEIYQRRAKPMIEYLMSGQNLSRIDLRDYRLNLHH